MAGKLSYSIAINLLTEGFKRGTQTVTANIRSMQMQVMAFAAAIGGAGIGILDFVSRMKDVSRETNRALTALKNISTGVGQYADSLQFLNQLAKKYGIEVNGLTFAFTKFTAAATMAKMPMETQKKVFESMSRATSAFGMSADDTNGVMLALSQMMSKGKISSEELRLQIGERLPVAIQAMAKAAGVSVGQLDKLLKTGKLMSADIIPKFADALNEMIPEPNTDNLEASINRLKNAFTDIVKDSDVQGKYKAIIDGIRSVVESGAISIRNVILGIVAAIAFKVGAWGTTIYKTAAKTNAQIVDNAKVAQNKLQTAMAARAAAEQKLNDLLVLQSQTTGNKKVAIDKKVAKAQELLSVRTTAVQIANEEAKAAAAKAAAVSTNRVWVNFAAGAKGVFMQLKNAFNSIWSSYGPAILIAAISTLLAKLVNLYQESKRVKGMFDEYRQAGQNAGQTQEVVMLEKQLKIANNINNSLSDRNGALGIINTALHSNYKIDEKTKKINGDINASVAKRIRLLRAAAYADYYATKIPEAETAMKKIAYSNGMTLNSATTAARQYMKTGDMGGNELFTKMFANSKYALTALMPNSSAYSIGKSDIGNQFKEFVELLKEYDDANKQLEKYVVDANKLQRPTIDGSPAPDEKKTPLQKAETKYTESLAELNADLELYKKSQGRLGKSQVEYDAALNDLRVKTVVDAKGTGDKALITSKWLKTIEDSINLDGKGLKDAVELEKVKKGYKEELEALTAQNEAGVKTGEAYDSAIQDLTNKYIDSAASVLGAKAKTDEFFNSLVALKNTKLQELQANHNKKLQDLTDQYKNHAITEKEWIAASADVIDDTLKLGASILGADAATNEWYQKLLKAKTAKPEKIDIAFNKEASDIMSESSSYQEAYKKLSESARKSSQNLITEIDSMIKNNPGLDLATAMKLAEAKLAVKDLRKEIAEGMYSDVKNMVSGIDGLVSGFESMNKTLSDTDASGWEKIKSIWNFLTSTIDGILSVIDAIGQLTEFINMLVAAKQTEINIDQQARNAAMANVAAETSIMAADSVNTQTKMANAGKKVAADGAEAAADSGKKAGLSLPFPINIIAIGAAIAAVMLAFSKIAKFANGGIVSGLATGDQNLARVNGGEMILNGSQQKTLFDIINNGINVKNSGGEVRFIIEGDRLTGVLNNYNRRKNRMS